MKKYLKTAGGVLGLIMSPVFSYLLFEYVTGNLLKIPVSQAVMNVGWMFLLYLAVFSLSGSSRVSIPVSSFIFYFISLAEAFVVSFRDRPIMLWDVLAVKTAMTVAGNYRFMPAKSMVFAGFLLLLMNLVLWFVPVRVKGWKQRVPLCAGGFILAFGCGSFLFTRIASSMEVNLWMINDTYENCGFFLSTAASIKYMVKKPPQGYSRNRVQEIYEETRTAQAEENTKETKAVQPVNLICIMNESLTELKVIGDYTTNIPYFPFLDSLTENTMRGSLCMPVFGSLTSNSEFEFLVGDSMSMMPGNSIAYQFFVEPQTKSLVSTLKDQGYTAIAMHPYSGDNWNRRTCYRNMGFDAFLDFEFYRGSEKIRNYISDQADYEKIIEMVEEKESPDDKLFLFNVTMQNHGGYEGVYDNFEEQVWLTGELEGKYPKTDQFLSLMKESDAAFEFLIRYFENCDEPTMIVMFGDHQPSVENGFFDDVYGVPSSEVLWQDQLVWYETPFWIWTNYETESRDMGRLGAIYLSSYMLERAGLSMTPYNQFLLSLSEELPVVHFLGCYTEDGTYYPWGDAEDGGHSFSQKLKDYEILVYNHSLDQRKVNEMFSLPGN